MSGSARRGVETLQTPWGLRPSDWELVPWSAFAARSGRPIVVEPDAKLKQVTVRVRHQGVTERRLNKNRPRRIGTPNQVQVSAGQFVISKIDARNGACGLIPDDLDGAIVTQDFPVYDIHAADPSYLDHLVDLPVFWRLCESVSDGTTNRVRLDLEQFDELRFPMPPLPEQRRIAAVLDAIDEAIARSEAVVAATEGLRRSLLHELLSEGLPGRHSAWREVAGVGRVPSSWEVVRLGEVGRWLSGGTPSKKRDDYWSGDLPWVSPKDMKTRELHDAEDHISREGAEAGSRVVPAGTIFVVVRGMILAHSFPLAVSRVATAFNQDIRALVCRDGFLPEFVLAAMEYQRPRLLHLPTPSTHGTMRVVSEELFSIQIPVPPLPEQRAIADALQSVDAAIAHGRSKTDVLVSLKASAAEALLSGRVRARGREG